MRWLAAACILVAQGTLARAATRDQIAAHFAPVLYQEAHDPIKDLFTAFDFDGNWNGDDQQENMECWSDSTKCNTADNPNSACAGQKCPLIATVYYTVIETQTHWFVQYMPYHPLDWKVTNGHENDTESVLMVIAKSGGPYGTLEAMETRFHTVWYQYAAPGVTVADGADNVDGPIHFDASGRPAVYSQMVGHGLCGGFSPPNYTFPDLQLTCNHNDTPHIDQTGVIYSPDLPATMPQVVSMTTVKSGYRLVELLTSVWPHIHEIGAGKAFLSAIDYAGERCAMFTCPTQFGGNWEGNEGQSPGEPWAQAGGNGVSADGDQFFDPAYTMSKRLGFPQPFSLDYCFNPYLAIADSCADLALPDGGTSTDAGSSLDGGILSDGGAHDASVSGMDLGPSIEPKPASGCGCALGGGSGRSPVNGLTELMFSLMLLAWSRARSRTRRTRGRARR